MKNPPGHRLGPKPVDTVELESEVNSQRLFASELQRQWSHRNRRSAALGLLGLLVLQVVASVFLYGSALGRPLAGSLELPGLALTLLSPLGSPFMLFWNISGVNVPVFYHLLQFPQWLVYSIVLFVGPAFAARSLAPDRETRRMHELILAGLSPRAVVFAKTGAAMLPFVALALGVGLLGAGLLVGLQVSGNQGVLNIPLPGPTAVSLSPRPDPFVSQCIYLASYLVQWLSLLVLLGAIGAACRSTRAAMFWCYAAPLLIIPVMRYGFNQGMRAANLWIGAYPNSSLGLVVSILELAVAAFLFHRAIQDLEHPDEQDAWLEVPRPAIWDLKLSDPREPDN